MATKPTGTTADQISQTSIQVSWTDSVDGVQYLIYSSLTDFSAAVLIGAAAAGDQLFLAYGLSPATLYRFYIAAIAADGSQSDPDGPAEAATASLLAAPHPFYAEPRGSASIWCSWTDIAGADLYQIYLGESEEFSEASLVMVAPQGRQTALIEGLTADHGYYAWILARSGNDTGELAGPVAVETLEAATGALDIDAIKQAIWAWANGVITDSGYTDLVIWANQDGGRPQARHVQLNINGPAMPGAFDSVFPADGAGQTFLQRGLRTFMVSVNCYAPADPGALALAARLQMSLSHPTLRQPLEAAGIGVGRISDARDLSAFLETRWESRVQFDFAIFTTLKEEITQDLIDSAIIKNITPS